MKKNPGKKSTEKKKAPTRAKAAVKVEAKEPSTEPKPASKAKAPRKKTPATSPFVPGATSPLSKESPARKSENLKTPAPEVRTEPPAASMPKVLPVDVPLQKPPSTQSPKAKPGKRPARSAAARNDVAIPPLLLEGDLPPNPAVSGPGTRYALAPQPVRSAPVPSTGELPEAYGTGRVFLAARDPHWLYVSWDFTNEQQSRFNAQSKDGHLIVRVFAKDETTPIVPEVHVHPESKNWFIHVPHAATFYRAEIGCNDLRGTWQSIAHSHRTLTPPDAPSPDLTAEFATIPADVTFQQVVEAVQQFVSVSKNEPLLEAVALATQAQNHPTTEISSRPAVIEPSLPRTSITKIGSGAGHAPAKRTREPLPIEIHEGSEWTTEQTHALARLIHIDSFRRVWMGSMEITELVRRQLQEEVASINLVESRRRRVRFAEEASAGILHMNVSSPSGGELPKSRKFWFKINAELIIYGATEPDARVTIAERPIKLRPDGSFSFRFSLPDGRYQLPAAAISSDGEEWREAQLEFSRSTEYRGEVEAHSQDAALQTPHRDHVK